MIVSDLAVSLPSWLAGVLLGGGLGYGCALVVHRLFSAWPSGARPIILFPWRTLLVIVLLPVQYVTMVFGLGPTAAAIMAGIVIFVCALPAAAALFLQEWHPSPLRSRLIGAARSLAVFSVVLVVYCGAITGGSILGATFYSYAGLAMPDSPAFSLVFWSAFFMALALDLLIGAAQFILLPQANA